VKQHEVDNKKEEIEEDSSEDETLNTPKFAKSNSFDEEEIKKQNEIDNGKKKSTEEEDSSEDETLNTPKFAKSNSFDEEEIEKQHKKDNKKEEKHKKEEIEEDSSEDETLNTSKSNIFEVLEEIDDTKNDNNNTEEEKNIDEIKYEGDRLTVNHYGVFVGGIPFKSDKQTMLNIFLKYGNVIDVSLPLNAKGKPSGIAFIEYDSQEAVKKVIENLKEIKGRKVQVNVFNKKVYKNDVSPHKIYLHGLSYNSTEDSLYKFFENCGEILNISIPVYIDSSKIMGVAIVNFKEKTAIGQASVLVHKGIDGRVPLFSNVLDE